MGSPAHDFERFRRSFTFGIDEAESCVSSGVPPSLSVSALEIPSLDERFAVRRGDVVRVIGEGWTGIGCAARHWLCAPVLLDEAGIDGGRAM